MNYFLAFLIVVTSVFIVIGISVPGLNLYYVGLFAILLEIILLIISSLRVTKYKALPIISAVLFFFSPVAIIFPFFFMALFFPNGSINSVWSIVFWRIPLVIATLLVFITAYQLMTGNKKEVKITETITNKF